MDDFELKLSDRTDDLTPIELIDEELCYTFAHELVDTLGELLGLHRILVLDVLEELGGEAGETFEVKLLAGSDGITDAEVPRVRQTDDVACEGLFYRLLTLSHEGRWAAELQALAEAHVLVACIALEATGADLDEGDTAAVVGVHVRMDLEDKASEGRFVGRYLTLLGLDRAGRWSDLYEAVEELLHTEVVECRAEEHGSDIA